VRKAASFLLALIAIVPAGRARAACDVVTTNLAFGAYDVFSPVPRDSTGTVTVSCDEAPPPDVVISIGPSAAGGGFHPRRMRHSVLGDTLGYNLYSDPSLGSVWGDGTAGTATVTLPKVKKPKPEVATIYGRIPPGQNVSVGSYSDTLTVTITW
jgi:spore coat protein U-like protein